MKVITDVSWAHSTDEGYYRHVSWAHSTDEGYYRHVSWSHSTDEGYYRHVSWVLHWISTCDLLCGVHNSIFITMYIELS